LNTQGNKGDYLMPEPKPVTIDFGIDTCTFDTNDFVEWEVVPDDTAWNFPTLKPLDDQQLADVRLKHAQADAIYIREGGIDPAYLWHIRHEWGYNMNPSYSLENVAEYQNELDNTALSGAFEKGIMLDDNT
jgi:hypothetical protein